ncbi:MAG TPA: hypothetical protein VEY89_04105, partial [Candidatus Dormibacteraeota bacterium]|nr:hypothetical protein [Candidatus Dormibacteraeota bacterium]
MIQRAAGSRFITALLGGLLALVAFIVVALIAAGPVTNGAELPLSSLQALATAGHVDSAVIYEVDRRVAGTYLPSPRAAPVPYWAAYPSSDAETPALVDHLAAGGATVSVDHQPGKAAVLFLATYIAPALAAAALVAIV